MTCRRRCYHTTLDVQTLSGTTTADSRGHSQKTFATVNTIQAAVKHLRGDETIRGREIYAKATHEVEVDYLATIDHRARFKFPGQTRFLNIRDIENVGERNRTLVCVCEEERTT